MGTIRSESSERDSTFSAYLQAGRAAWPQLALEPEAFARQLSVRITSSDSALDTQGAVHASDLYLACACSAGDPTAIRLFERRFLDPTLAYLRTRGLREDAESELRQSLLTHLFVSQQGVDPRIVKYRGQAPLLAWLRTVASRAAIDLLRQRQPMDSHSVSDLSDLRAREPDPELDYLKRLCRAELGRAFADILAGLSVREATFLRFHYLDGMTMEAIATLLRVSRRTVHRSISQCRVQIFEKTRALLSERLDISQSEFDTIMGLARSQLDLNMHELLAARAD